MRISDWSSDVCSSDLIIEVAHGWAIDRLVESPQRSPAMLNRRHFLATATLAGVAAPAILRAEGGLFRDFPFSLGVAAGDPSSDGFVIWTRLAPEPMTPHGGMPLAPVPVDWGESGRAHVGTTVTNA